MSWTNRKGHPKQLLKEIEKLVESRKISSEYDPKALALFCFLYNAGFYPQLGQSLSGKQSRLISKYLFEALDVPTKDIKNWPVLQSQYKPVFEKIGSNVSLISTLKRYGILNP